VTGLLIAGVAGAVIVLYTADRIMKARARARRMRRMTERLAAATARADQQHQERQAAAHASVAMTSVLLAISRPPGDPAHRPARPRAGREHTGPEHTGPQDRGSARPRRRSARRIRPLAAGGPSG